ncbi:hypothetical protein PLESTB_001132700 [Pleodorina starrii]|uniref:Ubiquitin-like protease family profile domain-containing protein n=1 Tax=Pleodorina starrii TaxID=330485 RepID=A0A9W6F507_9CHLO|nr:hypothetical protein PLESTB_001132700 [Pleodorina starrii]
MERPQAQKQQKTQAGAEGLHQLTVPRVKATAAGAAAGPPGRPIPRYFPADNFYGGRGGAGGGGPLTRNADAAAKSAAQQQLNLSQVAKTRRGQQFPQLQEDPGPKRLTSDADNENSQLLGPRPRAAGGARQRRRHSAPVEPEDKEPIDLADSSDDEAGAGPDADAGQRAKTGSRAGPGPSAAAARPVTRQSAAGPVTRQNSRDFQSLAVRLAGVKCCYPPEGGKHSVEVAAEDLARLEKGEFLNDTCIDFYIKHIQHNLPKELQARYHFFNSFFLKKLQEKAPSKGGTRCSKAEMVRQNHERVKKWTKHVDIFSKDYIFVPIHGYLHWSLVLICHPGNVVNEVPAYIAPGGADGTAARPGAAGGGAPLLLHLDSLDGNHAPREIFDALRGYLEHEWAQKAAEDTQDSVPRRWAERWRAAGQEPPRVHFGVDTLHGLSMAARLPKQDNHTDCGLFLLSYMDFFVAASPRCIVLNGASKANNVYPLDPESGAADSKTLMQKDWFKKCNAARLRDHLRALICGYMLERMPPEDERRGAAQCVVDDYDKRPCKLGERYLAPAVYLKYVTEQPLEPEPPDEDVISSGSAGEEHIEDAKDVLQSRRVTRAAVKQKGIELTGAIPFKAAANKRRKVQETAAGDAGHASQSAGGNNESVVDLSSPDKAANASQLAEQPAAGTTDGAAEGEVPPSGGGGSGERGALGDEDDGDEVEVLDSDSLPIAQLGAEPSQEALQVAASGGGGKDGTNGPPPKRRKLEAMKATALAVQDAAADKVVVDEVPSDEHQAAAGVPGEGAAATEGEDGDADGYEPGKQARHRQRRRRRKTRRDVEEEGQEPIALDVDGSDSGEEEKTAAPAENSNPAPQSSQEDPETLPGRRRAAAASRQAPPDAVAAEGGVSAAGSGQAGREGAMTGRVARPSAGRLCRKTKRAGGGACAGAASSGGGPAEGAGAEMDPEQAPHVIASAAANAPEPSHSGDGAAAPSGAAVAGQHDLLGSPQAALSHDMEPPLDGFVPGEIVDEDADGDADANPPWVSDRAEKLRAEAGDFYEFRASDDEQDDDFVSSGDEERLTSHVGTGGSGRRQQRQQQQEPSGHPAGRHSPQPPAASTAVGPTTDAHGTSQTRNGVPPLLARVGCG